MSTATRLQLDELDRALSAPGGNMALTAAMVTLNASKPPDWCERVARAAPQDLMLNPGDAPLLHEQTRARLNGPAKIYRHPSASSAYARAARLEPDLTHLISHFRRVTTGLKDGLRLGSVVADGGFSNLRTVFPPDSKIVPMLLQLNQLRSAAPLSHPLWNALLLRLMLQRLHPFSKGNGRTFRGLLSYDLHRAGWLETHYLPLAKVVDANRPALIRSRNAISSARNSVDLTKATAAALTLDASLVGQISRVAE